MEESRRLSVAEGKQAGYDDAKDVLARLSDTKDGQVHNDAEAKNSDRLVACDDKDVKSGAKDEDKSEEIGSQTVSEEPTAPRPKRSHLPSWVLAMREKIDESRKFHEHTESRISILNSSLSDLSSKIESSKLITGTKSRASLAIPSSEEVKENAPKKFPAFMFNRFPVDVLEVIMSYFESLSTLLVMYQTSKKLCETISFASNFWSKQLLINCPHLEYDSIPRNMHVAIVLSQVSASNECVAFIRQLKEQR